LETVAIFGDASKQGIGVVAYLIKRQAGGFRRTQLLYSKSTLMPKDLRKKDLADLLTIAREELIAITLCEHECVNSRPVTDGQTRADIHIYGFPSQLAMCPEREGRMQDLGEKKKEESVRSLTTMSLK
jgi:hypothetical protein